MADADLRPMSLGEVLDRTFNLYKNNFWLFTGITAMPFLVLLLINVGTAAVQTAKVPGVHLPGGAATPTALVAGAVGGALIFGLFYLFLLGAAQAATVFAVSDLYLHRTPSLRECYKRVGGKAFRVIVILVLVSLVVGVGFLCLVIPGLILLARTALSVPVSMLEGSKSIRSVERSMELTKGHAFQVFVIFIMVWIIASVLAAIFQFPLLIFVFNAVRTHHAVSFGVLFLQHLFEFISQVLAAPIGTIAFSLMYYNLRVRKEAFDIQHLMTSMGTTAAPNASSIA
jgi:Membrane domain of glycerophosphoryl diester phosphodiesterase